MTFAEHLEKLRRMLADEEKAKELNQADQHKRTPLHMAAFFGKSEAVAKLLEKGASPTLEAMDGFLPLHFAAQAGHLEVLRLLIRKVGSKGEFGEVKKHVNRVVHKGKKSALHLALLKGHAECAKFLALKGASLETKTAQGQTPLDLCQDQALKEELAGKAKAHTEEAAKEAGPEGEVADGDAAKPPEDVQMTEVQGDKDKEKEEKGEVQEGEPPAKRRAIGEAGSQTAAATGAGPWRLDEVVVEVAEAEKTYPEGVMQKADDEWELKMEEDPDLQDGAVWSLVHVERSLQLKLKLQKSSQKLLHYTHFSDEAGKLEQDSKCNACSLTVLTETSDGQLMLERAAESWHLVPGTSTLSSSTLSEALTK
ncbi:Ripk4, partial [Symbiodinium sp. CCMP2456]